MSFTGLRPHKMPYGMDEDAPACLSLKIALKKRLIEFIEKENVQAFISGMSMGIEMICAELVLELKSDYPAITLEAAVSHKEQDLLWPQEYRYRYRKVLEWCDSIHVVSEKIKDDSIEKRNRYVVDKSDMVLAVWNEKSGKPGDFMKYAQKKKKPIISIDPFETR